MATDPGSPVLHPERVLPAPRAAVAGAATRPDRPARWWRPAGITAPHIELDLRVGGRYRMATRSPDADVVRPAGARREVAPPGDPAFTFPWEEPDPDDRTTSMTPSFADEGRATRPIVEQGVVATRARPGLDAGGRIGSLDRLAGPPADGASSPEGSDRPAG